MFVMEYIIYDRVPSLILEFFYTSKMYWEKGDNLARGLEMIKLSKLFNVQRTIIWAFGQIIIKKVTK